MTVRQFHIVVDAILLVVIVILALLHVGPREEKIVVPPTLTEGWAGQVTQQAYLVVKNKQIIAICSREESAKKYAEERDASAFTVGINNGTDVVVELSRDDDGLTLNIASW